MFLILRSEFITLANSIEWLVYLAMSIAYLIAFVGLRGPSLFKYAQRSPWKYIAMKNTFNIRGVAFATNISRQSKNKRVNLGVLLASILSLSSSGYFGSQHQEIGQHLDV